MAAKKAAATSAPAQGADFARLFNGLGRAYGIYDLKAQGSKTTKGGTKVQGRARTVHGEVTQALWDAHLRGEQGLGVVPIRDDNTTVFGAIDIDDYALGIADIEKRCAALNLPVLPTSTKSGGVHLYVFMSEPVEAGLLKSRLEEWAVALGVGGSEVFPKQSSLLSDKDVGNWINMPYFAACADDADKRCTRRGVFAGTPLTAAEYIERADMLRIDGEQLEALTLPENEEFTNGPPCLQSIAASAGGFGEGKRNNGMFAIGVYLRKRYPDDWKAHMPLYNARLMRPPLPEGELNTLIKTLSRKEYGYTCNKPPCKDVCNKNLCRTREFGVGSGADDWGIVIDSDVLRIGTQPPHWVVTVNGSRMQMFSEDFMQQRRFQELCLQRIAYYPPPLPADKWRAEVNRVLQLATEVEAPPDASAGGELGFHLRQFCTVYPQAEVREELLIGKPYTEEGHTHFRAADFKKYLDSQHFRALSGPRLYAELRQMGLVHKQFWAGSHNVLVWVVQQMATHDTSVPPRSVKQEGAL